MSLISFKQFRFPHFLSLVACLLSFVCFSCSKLQHLDQALVLKGYAEERDAQDHQIAELTERFEHIVMIAQDGQLDQYADQKSVIQEFGQPLLKKTVVRDGVKLERWLYRHPSKAFDSAKVYLFFNQDNSLIEWNLIPSGN